MKTDLENEIIYLENFITEEERCLEYCINNSDECDSNEIEDRREYINELIDELEKLKLQNE